jgi:hypothetical protein
MRVCATVRCYSSRSELLSGAPRAASRQLRSSNSAHEMCYLMKEATVTVGFERDGHVGRSAVASHEQRTRFNSIYWQMPNATQVPISCMPACSQPRHRVYFHVLYDGNQVH